MEVPAEDETLLAESSRRQKLAGELIDKLGLLGSWGKFGRPVIVGAFSYGLFYEPDLDMEIYCPELGLAEGFSVFAACAGSAERYGITLKSTLFQNFLDGPDQALYWQMRLEFSGFDWKADMWSAREDYPLPRSENMILPMRRVLVENPHFKPVVLRLKEARTQDKTLDIPSIDIYRAVIDGGVRTPDELREWYAVDCSTGISSWIPGNNNCG